MEDVLEANIGVRELLFVLLLGSMEMEMGRPDDEEGECDFM